MLLTPNLESNFLHLGCGLTAPIGWLNVDGSLQVEFAKRPRLKRLLVSIGIYPRSQADIPWSSNILRLNLRKKLPFKDQSFTAIYSSHTFEHLYQNEAVSLANECYRIMKPGGICRIVVPDLNVAVQQYLSNFSQPEITDAADRLMDELGLYPRAPKPGFLGAYQNFTSFHNHKWIYDTKSLKQLLIEAGFSDVSNPVGLQGKLPDLEIIESPSRVLDGAGIVAEGIKL
jgi:SAM-dependent methyltransferase